MVDDISRNEAERRLKSPDVEGGTFIIRKSESDRGMIGLTKSTKMQPCTYYYFRIVGNRLCESYSNSGEI